MKEKMNKFTKLLGRCPKCGKNELRQSKGIVVFENGDERLKFYNEFKYCKSISVIEKNYHIFSFLFVFIIYTGLMIIFTIEPNSITQFILLILGVVLFRFAQFFSQRL